MPGVAESFSWTVWHGHPSVILGVLLLQVIYLLGVGPLRRRYRWSVQVENKRVVTFTLGLVVLFVALQSPIHDLGDRFLFSAHMVQHLLLIMVAVPLLLLGIPSWLPVPLLHDARVLRVARLLTGPLVAFTLFNAVFVLWHMPILYDAALRSRDVHILEHLMFIAAAVLGWWPVLGPTPQLPRLAPPGQMIYLFLQTIPVTALAPLLSFADRPLYEWYALAPRLWGISAMADQQIAALVMWIPMSLVYLFVMTMVFFAWAGREHGL